MNLVRRLERLENMAGGGCRCTSRSGVVLRRGSAGDVTELSGAPLSDTTRAEIGEECPEHGRRVVGVVSFERAA